MGQLHVFLSDLKINTKHSGGNICRWLEEYWGLEHPNKDEDTAVMLVSQIWSNGCDIHDTVVSYGLLLF